MNLNKTMKEIIRRNSGNGSYTSCSRTSQSPKRKSWSGYSMRKAESKSSEMIDCNTSFTKEELKIIGNLCETMKHWRRHNPEVRFPDSLYITGKVYS